MGVGVLVLVDAGGLEHAGRHLEATADLINVLPLGPGDLVSPLDGNEFLAPGDHGFSPVVGPGWDAQQADLKVRMPRSADRKAQVAAYSLEKQAN